MSVYRNKKLLGLARQSPKCFCCGRENDGTVVGAHADMQEMGKGMGFKAADLVAFVCHHCHDQIDGRVTGLDASGRKYEWMRAALLSLRWVLETHPEVFK